MVRLTAVALRCAVLAVALHGIPALLAQTPASPSGTSTKSAQGPRVLVRYDVEGLAGEDDWRMAAVWWPARYAIGQKLLADDVNAVVAGLFDGGASAVDVWDQHGWLPSFGHRRRDTIEDHEIEQQVREWQAKRLAASTIRHRLSALSKLYRELDGPRAYNPVATVARPPEPKPGANALPVEHLVKVFDAFEARVKQNNRGWKTLARCRIIAETGMRHSQVMRLQPADIWLDHDPPVVAVNQPGKSGKPHWKPLTGSGVEAFRLFIEKNAWGSSRSRVSTSRGSWPVKTQTCRSLIPTDCGIRGQRRCAPGGWT